MTEKCSPVSGNVHWRPASDTEIMPEVKIPCVVHPAIAEGEPADVLLFEGIGETRASGDAGVEIMAEHGLRAAAFGLSYSMLTPISRLNLDRICIEAPQVLAERFGGKQPPHVLTHSLGCLVVRAADRAPELISGVGVQAPYAFSWESFGRLPLVGASDVTRMVDVGWRLGVRTPLQHVGEVLNSDIRGVASRAAGELRALGIIRGIAVRYALSPEIGQDVVGGFVRLSHNHPAMAFLEEDDRLSTPDEGRSGLAKAAQEQGIEPTQVTEYVNHTTQVISGPHTPWCSPRGRRQVEHAAAWLQSLQQNSLDAATTR